MTWDQITKAACWAVLFTSACGLAFSLGVAGMSLARKPLTRFRLAACGVLAAIFVAVYHVESLEGVDGLILGWMARGRTEYASTYSAVGFWRIRTGMSEAEVSRLAGEPLERDDVPSAPGIRGWRWTRTPNDSSYHVRVVLIRKGQVVERISEYYVD